MLAKEAGWILSIDPASNTAGCSLWYNGELIATTELNSTSKSQKYSQRLKTQVDQLNTFLENTLPAGVTQIDNLVLESVRSKLVLITVGAYLCSPYINLSISERKNFVSPSSWKHYARSRGAHSQKFADVKGCVALREMGFPVDKHNITSDDVADSILLFLTWRTQK